MQRGVLHADARPLRRRSQSTYQQRYFVCDCHFRPGGAFYLNHTGLMWENAVELGAMLVSRGSDSAIFLTLVMKLSMSSGNIRK
ncbi:hypothetical protein PF001_g1713 [Phytophthora fragariae]|uniref:Uncharacterized protein n=1 Tax=Phytophthora fragariae TaxID=53985 RepID=A0A6A4F450_9STRA|nr:hypothetical protein PF001_g1713 [Phytophthora fragariae]